MKPLVSVHVFFLFMFTAACLLLPVAGVSAPQASRDPEVTLEGVAPGQVDAVLAKLSDEQVRSLLIAELQREAVSGAEEQRPAGGIYAVFVRWLKMMNSEAGDMDRRVDRVRSKIGQVPRDLVQVAARVGGEKGVAGFWLALGMVAGVLLFAYVVELLFRAASRKTWGKFREREAPQLDGLLRFWAAVFRILPAVVNLMVFLAVAFLLVVFVPGFGYPEIRMLFLALLVPLAIVRLFAIISHLMCAPQTTPLRLLPISDSTAMFLHRAVLFFVSYVAFVIMFLAFISQMGMPGDTNILVQIVAGTVLVVILAFMIFNRRRVVVETILSDITPDDESYWVKSHLASFWHILALSYLFVIWLIWTGQVIDGTARSGSFLLSLLVVPVFFILDGLGQWVVRAAIGTLRIYDVEEEIEQQDAIAATAGESVSLESVELTAEEKRRRLIRRVGRIMRFAIVIALGVWILDLWGVQVPFASGLVRAVFESLVTMTLGLMVWRFASSYIEMKIKESMPEDEESEEDQDGEWGAAAQRGRSYTLLPMVRKFIGTTLVVMVTLIILSSMGVNIGPLLAGAGVVGIALGFGAQKLVSDVLSGFFYLLDDAFRVGEYLQAGSVSGAVEAITLRNVMLRHHRGMLQIVPYSELGSITNFMRGGIVVKFNLEFPYDTDIDKVRKIIKRVGLAMLEDPEFGEDFIRPVKSQGVREITSSVMVIRVKFTAKPGTHFVIRREAYRRITEALAAKGIHYAHRKVIVELPTDETADPAQQKKITEAGAAAALAGEEEKKAGSGPAGSQGPAMPGM
jgi:small-conductance mechanosensitive channel